MTRGCEQKEKSEATYKMVCLRLTRCILSTHTLFDLPHPVQFSTRYWPMWMTDWVARL